MLNKDYREMLQCLLEEKVRFLLVGAYALAVHGFPRATKDIDFFVWATPENAVHLLRALARFGAPLDNDGIEFEQAYPNSKSIFLEGLEVPVISVVYLIANKRASGRTQDLADVEKLESESKRE
jgi:hypothetical protein